MQLAVLSHHSLHARCDIAITRVSFSHLPHPTREPSAVRTSVFSAPGSAQSSTKNLIELMHQNHRCFDVISGVRAAHCMLGESSAR